MFRSTIWMIDTFIIMIIIRNCSFSEKVKINSKILIFVLREWSIFIIIININIYYIIYTYIYILFFSLINTNLYYIVIRNMYIYIYIYIEILAEINFGVFNITLRLSAHNVRYSNVRIALIEIGIFVENRMDIYSWSLNTNYNKLGGECILLY